MAHHIRQRDTCSVNRGLLKNGPLRLSQGIKSLFLLSRGFVVADQPRLLAEHSGEFFHRFDVLLHIEAWQNLVVNTEAFRVLNML